LKTLLLTVVTLFILLSVPFVQAQKIKPENLKLAQAYKKQLSDEKLMALKSSIQYDFYAAKKSKKIEVEVNEEELYLSLSPNGDYVKRNYYDDYRSIEAYKILSEKNKAIAHDKVCGHIEDKSIFYSDAKVCAYYFKFRNIGQVVKFQGRKKVLDARYLTKVFLQTPLFNKQRTIVFKIPKHIEIELMEMNFDGYNIEKKEETKADHTIITYTVNEFKAFSNESNTPSFLHFVPHVLILTKWQTIDGKRESILSNTQELYNWYIDLKSGVTNDPKKIEPVVKEILQKIKTPTDKEKIELLFYWVQDNIKYIAFEDGIAGFKPEDAHTVLYNRYGDCKGMSNLLKEMLSIAGFDARLTWVGTRRIPYDYSIPSLAVDNHMVCSIMLADTTLVLDATEPFQHIDYVGERLQGQQVLIEDGASYLIKKLAIENIDINLIEEQIDFEIDTENKLLVGKGIKKLNGESKKKLKMFTDAIAKEKNKQLMEYVINNGDSKNYELVKVVDFDRKRPAEIEYTCQLDHQIQQFNDKWYVDLDASKQLYQTEVEEDRIAPIDFDDRMYITEQINLTLPKNLQVEYLPAPLNIKNDLIDAQIAFKIEGNKVKYHKSIKVLTSILKNKQFESWNAAINQLNKFYGDQLILKNK